MNWWHPLTLKLILVCLLGMVISSLIRFYTVARRISWSRKAPMSVQAFDPQVFAANALGSPGERACILAGDERRFLEINSRAVIETEYHFLHLCGLCDEMIRRSKRATNLGLWLSFFSIVHGAFPILWIHSNNSNASTATKFLVSAEQLLQLVSLETALCIVMYGTSAYLSDGLAHRKEIWMNFFAKCRKLSLLNGSGDLSNEPHS